MKRISIFAVIFAGWLVYSMNMKVLGIDLSSQPRDTAACIIKVRGRKVRAEPPQSGCNDETLDALIARVDAIGIDAPFGWPAAFVNVVAGWTSPVWNVALRDRLRFRLTDLEVIRQTKLRPLSVSTDQIALPGMRAMALLHRHRVRDKSGDGRFFEVYPAASLLCWGLPHRRYKGATEERRATRQAMLEQLRERFPGLSAPDEYAGTDHGFDALVAALTTVAALKGETLGPPKKQKATARLEGWIHLPKG